MPSTIGLTAAGVVSAIAALLAASSLVFDLLPAVAASAKDGRRPVAAAALAAVILSAALASSAVALACLSVACFLWAWQ